MKKPRANGAVIYNGPSRINGDPIIVVIVWRSTNKKTGDVAQVYIIREDKHPVEALRDNTDDAICGNCPLRYTFNPVTGKWERECYVNEGFGPANVYKEYKNGKYPAMSPTEAGLILRDMRQGARLGAYGDPAAVDVSIWQKLVTTSGTLTLGYTHQWKNPYFQPELLEYNSGRYTPTTATIGYANPMKNSWTGKSSARTMSMACSAQHAGCVIREFGPRTLQSKRFQ